MSRSKKAMAGYLLPDPISPYDTICVSFSIPNAREYRAAVYGHLMELTRWWAWEKSFISGDTRARDAAELFRNLMHETLIIGDCAMGGLQDVRQNSEAPCTLEKKIDDTWSSFANLRLCAPNLRIVGGKVQYYDESTETWVDYPGTVEQQPAEVPGGTIPVPSGECKNVELVVYGNAVSMVPFRVLPGDTVTLTYVSGAWTNAYGIGQLVQWTCGQGKVYALGQCGTQDGVTAGAVLPEIPAGRAICQYGTHAFDAMTSPFTIPPSWDEDLLMVRMNDEEIADNAGSIYVNVEICNPGEASIFCGADGTDMETWHIVDHGNPQGIFVTNGDEHHDSDGDWNGIAPNSPISLVFTEPECLRGIAFRARREGATKLYCKITYADSSYLTKILGVTWIADHFADNPWTGFLLTPADAAGSSSVSRVDLWTDASMGIWPITIQRELIP